MNVPPELIHPSDPFKAFMDLGDLIDPSAGSSVMENVLGLNVDHDYINAQEIEEKGPYMSSKTIADYLSYYLKNWDKISSRPEPSF